LVRCKNRRALDHNTATSGMHKFLPNFDHRIVSSLPSEVQSNTMPLGFNCLNRDGFSFNAAVACQPHQRQRLERLCRYVTRPAICLARLTTNIDGKVSYELKHPFRDGTTHILFTPQDFLARLAALVPRPRANLTRYFLSQDWGASRPTRRSGEQWYRVQRTRLTRNKKTDNSSVRACCRSGFADRATDLGGAAYARV
jgi:hypothetical protein